MTEGGDELALERLSDLSNRYSSGGETDLIAIELEDLGLPASTREAQIDAVLYRGGAEEVARESCAADEVLIEYEFGLDVAVRATMSPVDASGLGWESEALASREVDARGSFDLTARVGVRYVGDEVEGDIEYVGVRRTDGTPASPIGLINDDARIYKFPTRDATTDGSSETR